MKHYEYRQVELGSDSGTQGFKIDYVFTNRVGEHSYSYALMVRETVSVDFAEFHKVSIEVHPDYENRYPADGVEIGD